MSLRLGDTAPDFEQDSSVGRIKFHQWLGDSWGVLFSHPADFTPVCTTELGLTAKLASEFEKRNVKAIALSVDNVESHEEWIKDINETQAANVGFPILADGDRKVSELYDMIHPNANATLTVRSLFVIDPNKKVRLTITYPASTDRPPSPFLGKAAPWRSLVPTIDRVISAGSSGAAASPGKCPALPSQRSASTRTPGIIRRAGAPHCVPRIVIILPT